VVFLIILRDYFGTVARLVVGVVFVMRVYESKQGSDFQNINHDNLNLKLKDFGVKEYINLSPVNLNLFYQNIYNDYIQNLD
ncbi:MAG: hypothetical protein IIT37_07010, partial [Bacteroidales bacterium]|nr:hypothetical protein [Bacteroidales bacterium]